jgi:hypothetical protein
MVILHSAIGYGAMIAWPHDFVAIFSVMQDHGAVPHGAVQKESDCEIFADLIYFALKFPKKINCTHFDEKCFVGL